LSIGGTIECTGVYKQRGGYGLWISYVNETGEEGIGVGG
jgi:hypothetical protein